MSKTGSGGAEGGDRPGAADAGEGLDRACAETIEPAALAQTEDPAAAALAATTDQAATAFATTETMAPAARRTPLVTVPRDHYQVREEIAHGGMGRILAAQDQRLGRPVAIKELLTDTAETRARFEREAMVTARLQHPAIVPIYEAGQWPDGEPFFAMKMVAGTPLDKVVKQTQTLEQRLALLPRAVDVADALAYAHAQGVIHRDLKPANVLVGDFGETVVIDWGLAKVAGAAEPVSTEAAMVTTDAGLTVLGQALGTPAYMPPEQVVGEGVDARADVYALGALLYHLLGGRMAYAGSRSAEEVLSKVLDGPPEPLERLAPDVPPDLLTIVNKAMARRPEERYADASDLAEDLRRFVAGKLVAAHAYGLTALIGRWIRRHRGVVAVVAVAACALAALGSYSFVSLRRERDAANAARAREVQRRREVVAKGQELRLNVAASYATEQPLKALEELARLKGLSANPGLVRRARVIAALARSRGLPSLWTRVGSKPGPTAISPDGETLALAWEETRVALGSVRDKRLHLLPTLDTKRITALRFSPSGKWLAVGGSAKWLMLLETARPTMTRRIAVRRYITQIVFSPDERWLAALAGGQAFVVQLNEQLTTRRVPLYKARALAAAPDGKALAIAADHALLYDVASGEVKSHAEGRPIANTINRREPFSAVTFSPDGKLAIFADKRVIAVDRAASKSKELFSTSERVRSLAFDDKGTVLAAGAQDRIIYVHELGDPAGAVSVLTGHQHPVWRLAFANGRQELISAGEGGKVRLWRLKWLRSGRLFSGAGEVVGPTLGGAPVLHDGTLLLGYDSAGVLRLRDRKRRRRATLGGGGIYHRAVFALGRDRLLWCSGGLDHKVRLTASDGATRQIGDHGEQVELLSLSHDERFAASAGSGRVRLWDLRAKSVKDLEGHTKYLRYLAFARDGALLGADVRGNVSRWERSGKGRLVGRHGSMLPSYVAITSDPRGRWVATAGRDKRLLLHDVRDSKITELARAEHFLLGMAASPDGRYLAVSVRRGEITIFDTTGARPPVRRPSGDAAERLWHPSFSPDGRSLAATNMLTGVRVWRDWRRPGDAALLLGKHESSFPSFSPDSARIVAPGKPAGTVSIWDVTSGQRRDLRSDSISGRAAFWPRAQRIVSSDYGGKVHLWPDDLPTEWSGLRGWIEAEVEDKSTLPRVERPAP